MNKRYWLRGGIFGIIYFGVSMLIGYLIPSSDPAFRGIIGALLNTPAILIAQFSHLYDLANFVGPSYSIANKTIIFLEVCLVDFIIGAFLGWLYGKIKNRNVSKIS